MCQVGLYSVRISVITSSPRSGVEATSVPASAHDIFILVQRFLFVRTLYSVDQMKPRQLATPSLGRSDSLDSPILHCTVNGCGSRWFKLPQKARKKKRATDLGPISGRHQLQLVARELS